MSTTFGASRCRRSATASVYSQRTRAPSSMISIVRASPPAAGDEFGIGPDIEANFSERAPVFFCSAAGEENSCPADFVRQLGEDRAQTLGRGEPKIRRWQFSLFEGGPLRPGVNVPGYNFNE